MTNSRPLVIDDEARAAADRVRTYAEANHYNPRTGAKVPGDDPRHVLILGTYRAVFSITDMFDPLHRVRRSFRHLSVSIPDPKRYPHPVAVCMIADVLGFTGWSEEGDTLPSSWLMDIKQEEHCVAVVQERSN